MSDTPFDDEGAAEPGTVDVRADVADRLLHRMDVIISDGAAIAFGSGHGGEPEPARRLASILLELTAGCVRTGRVDPRRGLIGDLHRAAIERGLSPERVFTAAYLLERAALDELALDPDFGSADERWPQVAQLVRRATIDSLAGYTEHLAQHPPDAAIYDERTNLHTRGVLLAALEKELLRAKRFPIELAFIEFDVDGLTAINTRYGHGVGDRVIERLGVLVRQYFRADDWVARGSGDAVSVLLARTGADAALALAELVRGMVEQRLAFRDQEGEPRVPVTVSAAVITIAGVRGGHVAVDRVLVDVEQALARAKRGGGNRVEHGVIEPSHGGS